VTVTVDIPGGQATFREQDELTVGASRAVARALRRVRRDVITAPTIAVDGQIVDESADPDEGDEAKAPTDLIGLPIDLTEDDLDATWAVGDVMILAMLESWTLPGPVPADSAALEALTQPVYMALQQQVAKMQRAEATKADQFGPDGVEDPASPTGA